MGRVSPLLEIPEVLEDVQHHSDKVIGAAIDNSQFPPRRWDLFPQAPVTPSAGDEQENDATDDELFHGYSSLSSRAKDPSEPRRAHRLSA